MATEKITYLYIDDEFSEGSDGVSTLDPIVRILESEAQRVGIDLHIIPRAPRSFEEEIIGLPDSITSEGINGLILDWRLDSTNKVHFRAGSLGQEIRTVQTEGMKFNSFPIVLISTQQRLSSSYTHDDTSHDLFDWLYKKNEIMQEGRPQRVAIELMSFVHGYNAITKEDLVSALGPKEITDELDIRLQEQLSSLSAKQPVHDRARFVLKQMLKRPGPLINEWLVAARLGVDIPRSKKWEQFKAEVLANNMYSGPFNEALPRWWVNRLDAMWPVDVRGRHIPLLRLGAQERVEIINSATGYDLIAAEPLVQGYSDRFSTICEVTCMPLDPINGVIIDEPEPQPWQSRRYMSLDIVLSRKYDREQLQPHALELERIRTIEEDRQNNA
jgi:hypothetical protein